MSDVKRHENDPVLVPSTISSALVLQMRRAAMEAVAQATPGPDRALGTTEPIDEEGIQRFAEKVAADTAIGGAGVLAYIGDRLGLWAALAHIGPVAPDELAASTGLHPRYLAEWLAGQAAAGYLTYDAETGRFTLPAAHAAVLADGTSPADLSGVFEYLAGCWADAVRIADAFRTGEGLAWGEHDTRLLRGLTRFFRPLYEGSLSTEWLPALDGVLEVLERGARVLDVGCGYGTSTVLMAERFPKSRFTGIDPDEESLVQARLAAERADVADRVTFQAAHAEADLGGGWDLICFFDAFHHLGNPVAAARQARKSLAPDGVLMLVEPLARDRIEDNLATPAGLDYYSASTLVCVPDALAQPGGFALGAQAGPQRLADVLTASGFSTISVVAETDFNLVMEARP
jgi:SAM-dependent methyltransferase